MERTKENLAIAAQVKIIYDKNLKIAHDDGKTGAEAEEYALSVSDNCLLHFRTVRQQSLANAYASGMDDVKAKEYADATALEVLTEIAETGGYHRTQAEQMLYDMCP